MASVNRVLKKLQFFFPKKIKLRKDCIIRVKSHTGKQKLHICSPQAQDEMEEIKIIKKNE